MKCIKMFIGACGSAKSWPPCASSVICHTQVCGKWCIQSAPRLVHVPQKFEILLMKMFIPNKLYRSRRTRELAFQLQSFNQMDMGSISKCRVNVRNLHRYMVEIKSSGVGLNFSKKLATFLSFWKDHMR